MVPIVYCQHLTGSITVFGCQARSLVVMLGAGIFETTANGACVMQANVKTGHRPSIGQVLQAEGYNGLVSGSKR